MSKFYYKGDNFKVENTNVSKIVLKHKTPFYLYSENLLKKNYKKLEKIFSSINPLLCFSVKSNSNLAILKILKNLGSGADVVSGGELLQALNSGIKANKIVFSGVGKSNEEIELAIKKKILLINAESLSEVNLINNLARKFKKKISVGLRLNPNVTAKTNRKISTGSIRDKFGLNEKDIKKICLSTKEFKNIRFKALSVHIGSQILSDKPFIKTLKILEKLLRKIPFKFEYIDLGGGFGIKYEENQKSIKLNKYSNLVKKFKLKHKCKIIFEPGRSIVGDTAVLVSKVQYIKRNLNKNFVIIDAGMNDFMRPALYGAKHRIIPLKKNKRKMDNVEFSGPICETSCKFTFYKKFQNLGENDLIAIENVGAYGSSLSSNYNLRPIIKEILVNKNRIKVIKKRQKIKDILKK